MTKQASLLVYGPGTTTDTDRPQLRLMFFQGRAADGDLLMELLSEVLDQ
jgi:hypothetical protein